MAQLKDILEIERRRIPQGPHNTIYLFPEGTFYRAYEWSAWLCCRYMNQFKATRREMKGEMGETVVFIGFPITSLGKFLPEDAQVSSNEDKSVSIALPVSVFREGEDTDASGDAFRHWKKSIPLAVTRKGSVKDDLKNASDAQPHRLSEIMLRQGMA